MLLFKKRYLPAIRAGTKTQTVRLWKHSMMKAGQRSYVPGAGYIRVLAVDPVDLEELDQADAAADGFPSAAALRREIATLYPAELAAGYQAYRVRFRLCTEVETAQAIADKERRKAAQAQRRSPSTNG